ncbi:MAG: ABC transporter permease [Gemmatimonadaceae bacterium]
MRGVRAQRSCAAFVRDLAARLREVHGITGMAITSTPPGRRNVSVGQQQVQGEPVVSTNKASFIDVNAIDGAFFRVMGMPLTEGTMFTDTTEAAGQVIVNASFARLHRPNGHAVGQHVRVFASSDKEPWLTIVGVANDASTSGPMLDASMPIPYSPARTVQRSSIMIRTTGDVKILVPIRELARSMSPRATFELSSVEGGLSRAIAAPRFVTLLLMTLTGLALILAAVGMYGVMAYTVTQKTREIGIRVALEASSERIAAGVLLRGAALTVLGSAIGLASAAWGTKLIRARTLSGCAVGHYFVRSGGRRSRCGRAVGVHRSDATRACGGPDRGDSRGLVLVNLLYRRIAKSNLIEHEWYESNESNPRHERLIAPAKVRFVLFCVIRVEAVAGLPAGR